MKYLAKIIIPLVLLAACGNKESASPFDEILAQPPYAALTDSIRQSPKNEELYFRRAVLLNKNDQPEPALADFRKAWSLKKDERYAFGISKILLDKRPDSAILFLQDALKELPNSPFLSINLIRAYAAQQKNQEALALCNDLLKADPGQTDILKMKAEIQDALHDSTGSLHTLEAAYAANPADVELNYRLAFSYAQTKNPKALTLCDSLAKADLLAIHAEPYFFRGVYYANINDRSNALSFFEKAIQHDYNFLDAYMEKGRLQYDMGNVKDAFKTFGLAVTISPSFADAYYWRGRCLEKLGDKDEAKLDYERAYGLDKTLTEARDAATNIKN
jgi:tetratricopeptide (TPR) repeat protein